MNRAFKIIAAILSVAGVAAVLTVYILITYDVYVNGNPAYGYDYIFFIVIWLAADLLSPFFHELGHALFGLFSGMRAKISLKSLLPEYRASSVEIIPKRENAIKARLVFTLAGGLFVNLVFIVLGVLALAVPAIPACISGVACGNIFLFFMNVVPAEYATGKTDMLVLCELSGNSPEAQVALAVLKVQAHVLNGKPIERIDREVLFSLPQIREDDPSFISLCELRGEYLEAVGDAEGAKAQFARFEELKREYLD